MYPSCTYVTARLNQLYIEERQAEAERARRSRQVPDTRDVVSCATRLNRALRTAARRVALVRAKLLVNGERSPARLAAKPTIGG